VVDGLAFAGFAFGDVDLFVNEFASFDLIAKSNAFSQEAFDFLRRCVMMLMPDPTTRNFAR